MTTRTILLAGCLAISATSGLAAERYKCPLTVDEGGGAYKQDANQYVTLSLDGDVVRPIIHIRDASKDLTFATCKGVRADGSNFALWFKTECTDLKAVDGSPYTFEPFLVGAYAGVSPVIDPMYSMYSSIDTISKKAGINFPIRTFAIYADRKPLREFFCYADTTVH